MNENDLAERAARLLGGGAIGVEPVAGGSLSRVLRVRLASGGSVVAKTGPSPETEAAMLRAIAAAGAPAPKPLAADDAVLVLTDLGDAARRSQEAERALGEAVARLHAAKGPHCGWGADYAFAHVAILNGWDGDWPGFWAERRLLAGIEDLPSPLARRVERLAADLPNRLPKTACALLHGDLWSGNVFFVASGGASLIDPACFYGDPEVDLAMLTLFGRPGPAFFEAYGALAPGAEARRPVYQLWPAITHLRLFGGGYASLVDRLLSDAGA